MSKSVLKEKNEKANEEKNNVQETVTIVADNANSNNTKTESTNSNTSTENTATKNNAVNSVTDKSTKSEPNFILKETPAEVNADKKNQDNSTASDEKKSSTDDMNKEYNNADKKNKQLKKYKSHSGRKKKLVIALIVVLILVGLLLSTIFGILVSHSNKIASGVSAFSVDISCLTQSEATEKLTKELNDKLEKEFTFKRGEYETTLKAKDFGITYPIDTAVTEAYDIGRSSGNIFSNNFSVLTALITKTNVTPEITYKSDAYSNTIKKLNSEIPDRLINTSYQIDGTNLIIANSTNGYRVKEDDLKNKLKDALANNENTIEIPVEQYEADKVDIDAIYKEVHKDPVDASYTTNPKEIHKEENGLDFAISMEQAREIVSEQKDSYTIPLKVIVPNVTVKSLPQEAFPDLLATYSTTYASSNYNRSSNIALAGKSVNNTVLMPGETFSYNDTVGQRTAARGYKEAGVYVNGQVSTDYGGGICQVSSTLYNAVLLSNLEVVERTNHTFEPSYVPAGQDATVSWRSPDFKFKNNRSYPIRISTQAGGGRIIVNIYGLKSDDDYDVKIYSTKTGTIPFSTQYQNDSSLPAGTTKVTQAGSNGCTSQTYQILYKNGEEVSRKLINSDTYKPHNQVVLRGTKVVSTPEPTPDPTPDSGNDVTVTNEPAQTE